MHGRQRCTRFDVSDLGANEEVGVQPKTFGRSTSNLVIDQQFEVAVVSDDAGEAIIRAMPALWKFLERWSMPMTKGVVSRAERAANLERWADVVSVDDVVRVETSDLVALLAGEC